MATPVHEGTPASSANSNEEPRSFARQHARSQTSFKGSSRIGDYKIIGKLGEGTFGEVSRAMSLKTGTVVALKKILMHNEKDGFPITALREIKLLKLLSHPNVLRLEEMAVEHHLKSTDKRKRAIMYMVTPYMDHDLSGLLENPSVHLEESHIKCYMLQLLEGVRYLHDNHILHRDMKAANLLINNKGILQIADFGLARHYDEHVPIAGQGSGEARRDYTVLVVTRWYRPPELLLQLRKYTPAIDMWGIGCVFGEMLQGKPILAGDSDQNQLRIIFDLVGTPNEETMPGWRHLPGAEGVNPPPHPSTISTRFRDYGSGAISLLTELMKLDWRKRINAIDALKHPYFRNSPLPTKSQDMPIFDESHELDRRKFRSQKAAPPPAPKGGTVGVGPDGGWGIGGPGGTQNGPYQNGNGHNGHHQNGVRPHHPPPGGYRNGVPPPPPPEERRQPAWRQNRDDRPGPDTRLPARPPGGDYPPYDGRERPDGYRSRSREPERNQQRGPRLLPPSSSVDTYIPSYNGGGRRDDRPRDDRPSRERDDRRSRERDDRNDRTSRDRDDRPRDRRREEPRHHDRDRPREWLDYDERSRGTRTRSRSPSAIRERGVRDRESLEPRERDGHRERDRDYRR